MINATVYDLRTLHALNRAYDYLTDNNIYLLFIQEESRQEQEIDQSICF